MKEPLKVYIGYDTREHEAYEVARKSILRRASVPVLVTPIELGRNMEWEIMLRPFRIKRGTIWDVPSDAPASTQFAASRFLTPLLAQTGWAAFLDCDVIALADIAEMFALADPKYAVMVVKHNQVPTEEFKMDGAVQTTYPRKNWSSVMLWNCDHPSNRRLTLHKINNMPGRDLHRFEWLDDNEIGALPGEWNWLVDVEEQPQIPKIAHFTLGGPWLPGWDEKGYDYIWRAEREYFANEG